MRCKACDVLVFTNKDNYIEDLCPKCISSSINNTLGEDDQEILNITTKINQYGYITIDRLEYALA